ncbi:hypothetical protein ACFXGA_11090 [Actinosynnema sp. NPDC059335]|uniref:SPW repeat domain-containing protein n=1 Tax=Actinosynnema sp. NPDC059335 TaxID=3346804 RepID=UPI00366CC1D5
MSRAAGRSATSFGAVLGLVAGLWLVMAPFALRYPMTGGDLDRQWTTVLAGSAVLVCSLVHALAPRETPWLPLVLLAVGAWLTVTPQVEEYAVARAAANDTITGAVVVLAAVIAVIGTVVARAHRDRTS